MAIELPRVTARRDPGPVLWAVAGGCWLLLAGLAVLNPGLAHHHGVVADLRSGTAVTAALTTFAGAWDSAAQSVTHRCRATAMTAPG